MFNITLKNDFVQSFALMHNNMYYNTYLSSSFQTRLTICGIYPRRRVDPSLQKQMQFQYGCYKKCHRPWDLFGNERASESGNPEVLSWLCKVRGCKTFGQRGYTGRLPVRILRGISFLDGIYFIHQFLFCQLVIFKDGLYRIRMRGCKKLFIRYLLL